jgi:TetR/AcrR family transcriptional repressor of mexCD-oprJ operon
MGAILDAAAEVLARDEQANMSDVATAAGVARATLYRYFPSREALLEALSTHAVEQAGDRLRSARLDEVPIEEGFPRVVRALVVVGDYFVVLARERTRADREQFERDIAAALRKLIERGQSLEEIRDDIEATWLMESFFAIVVSVLLTSSSRGVEDTVDAITSLYLDGARGGTARK